MQRLEAELERLKAKHSFRSLRPASGRDFTSNDYLGFAAHPALREAVIAALDTYGVVGAGGSRLLRGNHVLHQQLEEKAARFFGAEAALYFGSGYLANLALFTTLPTRHDAVVFDESIHASMKEGLHAGQAAKIKARHNDLESFREGMIRARANGAKKIFLAVESLYSMDGDFAPLDDLATLTREFGATLIVDEAHATGVFGPTGRGLAETLDQENLIAVHTGGKALGVAGALVTGRASIISYLINAARPFIYSTALPPMLAAALTRALELVEEEPWRREMLKTRIADAERALDAACGDALHAKGSQIVPVILGSEARAVAVAERLQEQGFDIRAIRPPTVPEGTSRLRISLSTAHSPEDIAMLGTALQECLEEAPA